jgi:outer membrane protein, heavy metal efflux system
MRFMHHSNHLLWPVVATLAALLAGCGARQEADWPQPHPPGLETKAFRASADPTYQGPRPQVQEPSGPLSLRAALALTLLGSPRLASYAHGVRASEAEELQASQLPNPELEVDLEDIVGSGPLQGVDALQLTVRLSQVVELGGKRSSRIASARHQTRVAAWDYELKRVEVLAEVSGVFVDLLAAQELHKQAQEMERLAQRTLTIFQQKAQAGKIAPLEVSRAEVAAVLTGVERAEARKRVDKLRLALAERWGRSTARFSKVVGRLEIPATVPPLRELVRRLSQNAELRRWAANVALKRTEVQGERSRAYPDLTVAAGYRYLNELGDSAAVVGLSIPLPLFRRNQGGVRAARHRLAQSESGRKEALTRISVALRRGYLELLAARREASQLREKVLPLARRSFEGTRQGYAIGRNTFLAVLDAQRDLFAVRRRFMRAQSRYHRASLSLERLLGAPLSSEEAGREEAGRKEARRKEAGPVKP